MGDCKKVRLIVTDLDGTLLLGDKTISDNTADVIKRLREEGIRFGIATARPIRSVKNFLPFLTYDFAIFHNGAVVMDGEKLLPGFGIENVYQVVIKLMNELPGAHICLEAEDVMYSSFNTDDIWPGFEYVKTEDFHEVIGKTGDKIIIEAGTREELERIKSIIPDNLYAELSEGQVVMIMNKKATKFNGIKIIAERYNVNLEEVAAFGDDYNDICMLENCGIGVAVGNALEEVKKAANYVCDSNEADGEANWIRNNILL